MATRRRQSMKKAITKGIARVVAARLINDLVEIIFDALTESGPTKIKTKSNKK